MADLPFGSYQASPEQAYFTAARFMKDARVAAVKLESGSEMAPQIERLTRGGIPVCAHLGFTPQSEHILGGYRVQGRHEDAEAVVQDAHAVQRAGAFAVLIEMVPAELAARITAELTVPTIGIGAGPATDAQVLVWHDAAGLNPGAPLDLSKGTPICMVSCSTSPAAMPTRSRTEPSQVPNTSSTETSP
jgi:3-methyl-2-oxobutanoate hydroxymethyltransferase